MQDVGGLREALLGLLQTRPPQPEIKPPLFDLKGGALSFDTISFGYRPNAPVFQDFSLEIKAGEKVALVGSSGSGKSTLVSLLLGLWEPESGQIRVDGQDIKQVDHHSLLKHMAVIPQDTALFHRTLYENISYGCEDVTPSKVEQAARAAHIHDFISCFPDGYNTQVGERGLKLSGGQRQRIGIARAILKNAPILILDEATSALDSESEAAIQDALQKLMPGKTVLAIAHRLSTIAPMDRILVLEHGRIIEQGNQQSLLNAGGTYARLWAMQSGGYLPKAE